LLSNDRGIFTELFPSNGKGIFTETLLSNDKRIHIQTHRLMGGIFNEAVEMGPGAVIHLPSFIKIGSGIQKLIGGIHRHRQQRDLISLLYFIKIRKVG
jgi:hypothetical protein